MGDRPFAVIGGMSSGLKSRESVVGIHHVAEQVARRSARKGRARIGTRGVRITRTVERECREMFVDGLSLGQIGHYLGISKTVASRLENGKYRFGPDAGVDETTPQLVAAVTARHVADEQERIAERFCASAANQSLVQAMDVAGQRLLAAIGAEA